MWEFEIVNKRTREHRMIYGYTANNAFRKFRLDPEDWILLQKKELEDAKD
jgi:hypothetical protein